MQLSLKLLLQDPIDYELLRSIYNDKADLEKAWPGAMHPVSQVEWEKWFLTGLGAESLLFSYENSIAGHLILRLTNESQLYLCFIILDKRFRGQGLIYEMLNLVEEFVKTKYSNRELYLHVDPENLNALKAYEKHGYQKIGLTDKARFKMRKVLS